MPAEVDTMFSAREIPWHKLGTVTPNELTADEALVASGLDWEVTLEPIYVGEGSDARPIDGRYATVRSSDGYPLGVVGNQYTVFQNGELFELVDAMLDGARFVTAGSLRGGRNVWVLAQVGDEIVFDGDRILPYLGLFNWHDGSGRLRGKPTPVRVVCANTQALALAGSETEWGLRHTSTLQGRVEEARKTLGLTFKYYEGYQAEIDRLTTLAVTPARQEKMLKAMFPDSDHKASQARSDNRRDEIRALLGADTNARFAGTAWGLISAVTEWEQWNLPVRGGDDADRADRIAEKHIDGAYPITTWTTRQFAAKTGR